MARKQSRYYKGMLLRHKKQAFIIKLLDKHRTRWIFELVSGEIPPNFRPDIIFDTNLITYNVYSYDTIRSSFIPITDSAAGKLLYGL